MYRENGIDNYVWKKKAYDRYGTINPNLKIKEYGWGYEHRERNPDIQHNWKKKEHCSCCRLNAHKLHNKHLQLYPLDHCPYWPAGWDKENPCMKTREHNRKLCWQGWKNCQEYLARLVDLL